MIVGLPSATVEAARDSVGAATQIAASLPGPVGDSLGTAARGGFTDALGLAVLVSSGVAVLGAILVARFMPARHQILPVGSHGGKRDEVPIACAAAVPVRADM